MIIKEDPAEGVWLLTIDRDERRNAMDVEHLDALRGHVEAAPSGGARVVVLTGAGSAFCSGADLDAVYGQEFRDSLYATLGALAASPLPVLAAVNGPAIGAGAQLAIACDLRVGTERARFAVPTSRNGLAVDPWTVRRLALLTNGAVARNLLIGADTLDAERALGLGLLARRGGLPEALAWAEEIATLAPLSLAWSKRALDVALEPTVESAELDRLFEATWSSADVAEGRAARAERRTPVFRGE